MSSNTLKFEPKKLSGSDGCLHSSVQKVPSEKRRGHELTKVWTYGGMAFSRCGFCFPVHKWNWTRFYCSVHFTICVPSSAHASQTNWGSNITSERYIRYAFIKLIRFNIKKNSSTFENRFNIFYTLFQHLKKINSTHQNLINIFSQSIFLPAPAARGAAAACSNGGRGGGAWWGRRQEEEEG